MLERINKIENNFFRVVCIFFYYYFLRVLRLFLSRKTLFLSCLAICTYFFIDIKINAIVNSVADLTDGFSIDRQRTRTTEIVIHHDGVNDTVSIRAMAEYHTTTKGWGSISYHWYIYKDRIYHLHRNSDQTVHAGNHNACAVAVCVHGDFTKRTATITEYIRIAVVIRLLEKEYGLTNNNVFGHKDVNPNETECPGTLDIELIKNIASILSVWI